MTETSGEVSKPALPTNDPISLTQIAATSAAPPRYAVVLKAHSWDDFIARQVGRYRSVIGQGELHVFVDETTSPAGLIPLDHIMRATTADAVALGLADRSERNSLFWWNTDYPHYIFFDKYPDFDYYLFAEYDTLIQRDIDTLMVDVASAGADLVALPTREPDKWMWTKYHLTTYTRAELTGSLNCITICSRRNLRNLFDRRRELTAEHRNGTLPFWPFNEAFMATETRRAGYRFHSLDDFGDADKYEWFPPCLEADIAAFPQATFVHPVLDQRRYIRSLLRYEKNLLAFHNAKSPLRRALSRFPQEEYQPLLTRALYERLGTRAMDYIISGRWSAKSWFRKVRDASKHFFFYKK